MEVQGHIAFDLRVCLHVRATQLCYFACVYLVERASQSKISDLDLLLKFNSK